MRWAISTQILSLFILGTQPAASRALLGNLSIAIVNRRAASKASSKKSFATCRDLPDGCLLDKRREATPFARAKSRSDCAGIRAAAVRRDTLSSRNHRGMRTPPALPGRSLNNQDQESVAR